MSTEHQHAGADTDDVDRHDRGWPTRWLLAIAVFMIAALVGGWWVLAGQAAREVVAEDLAVVCDEGRTKDVEVDSDGNSAADAEQVAARIPSVELSRGMDCRLEVSVRNRGRWTATVKQVVFPFFGEASAMGPLAFELRGVDGKRVHEAPLESETLPDRDATWLVGRQLAPGEVVNLTLEFGLNPNACMSTGGSATLQSIPHVTTRVLGRQIDSTPTDARQSLDLPALRFEGTSDSSCDPE